MISEIDLSEKVLELAEKLKAANIKIVTAESCTGGGLSYILTNIPGSSNWFDRGFVTYSDDSKIDILNVDKKIIKQFGAVSEETALQMVEGALKKSDAQVAIAITGIAGPDGGTDEKPVGTVWIAIKYGLHKKAHLFNFTGDRKEIRLQSINCALDFVQKSIAFN